MIFGFGKKQLGILFNIPGKCSDRHTHRHPIGYRLLLNETLNSLSYQLDLNGILPRRLSLLPDKRIRQPGSIPGETLALLTCI